MLQHRFPEGGKLCSHDSEVCKVFTVVENDAKVLETG